MNDGLLLELLRRLLPHWTIALDVHGVWRAAGRTHVAASSVDGLVDAIRTTDPDGVSRAVRLLRPDDEVG